MNKFIYSTLLLVSFFTNAQKSTFNTQNSDPTTADLEATVYAKDSLADALYIYEEGFTAFDEDRDYNLITKYEAKIKIFNKDGFHAANIEIPLYKSESDSEKIENLQAYTYNLENGEMVKYTLNPADVYTEENTTYDLKKFTFPDVRPGSVLYYTYEKVSPYKYSFETWKFQDYFPKAYSKFTAKIPANYEYHTTLRGSLKLKSDATTVVRRCISFKITEDPADCIQTTYDMEDIPAFRTEKYLTSANNYLSQIRFELKQITRLDGYELKYTKEWKDADKELESDKNIGKQLKKLNAVEDYLPAAISRLPNNLEKARQIFNYVQEDFNWNSSYGLLGVSDLKQVLEDKAGTVLQINTVLHNVLAQQGFNVLPVISATRTKGFPSRLHPVIDDFNYLSVQLKLEEKAYLLDASDKNLEFGMLPYRALNSYARLLDFENGSSWIDIQPVDYSKQIFRDMLTIHPDGSSTGYSLQSFDGYHALTMRDHLEDLEADEIFSKAVYSRETTHADSVEVTNLKNKSENLEIKFSLKNKSQKIDDKIYFNPFSFKIMDTNPFKQENRTYPVDMGYKKMYLYAAMIKIPEGYKVLELPESKNLGIQGNGASLRFSAAKANENTISVQYRLSFPHTVYPADYYKALQQFFDQILEVQDQSLIVLEENS